MIFELETTEEDYLQDLIALKQTYMRTLRESALVTVEECNTLFFNVVLLIEHNQKFLDALKLKREESTVIDIIGDAFFVLVRQIPHTLSLQL